MHSPDFREEFYGLIRNDEIYIRLYSLHLFLLAERLKSYRVPISSISDYFELKRSLYILGARRFPNRFYQKSYQNFHSHLPEELFFRDFKYFLRQANQKTYKNFRKAFTAHDKDPESQALKEVIHNTTFDS